MLASITLDSRRRPTLSYLTELQNGRNFYSHQLLMRKPLTQEERNHLNAIVAEINRVQLELIGRFENVSEESV